VKSKPYKGRLAIMKKILVFTVLTVFVLGLGITGSVMAGEKFKTTTVYYAVKWEKVDVPDEEGHFIGLGEYKGISKNMEGKTFGEGWVAWYANCIDITLKTGVGSGKGYAVMTDRDGDKIYWKDKGKRFRGALWASYWESELTITGGTGKYTGIRGTGTASAYPIAPNQWYADAKWDVELP
jgi:hypothetical protein